MTLRTLPVSLTTILLANISTAEYDYGNTSLPYPEGIDGATTLIHTAGDILIVALGVYLL